MTAPAPPYDVPSRAQIARAVPRGSRRCRSQRAALRAAAAEPDLARVRREDFRHHLIEFYRVLVRYMDWQDGTTRPGRERVCEAVIRTATGKPISTRTFQRCRQWWEDRGYLGTVSPGWTPMLGPGVLADPEARNHAPVYVIAAPARPPDSALPAPPAIWDDVNTGALPTSPWDVGSPTHARGRSEHRNEDRASRGLTRYPSAGRSWRLGDRPKNRSEGRLAAEALQERARVLARITAAYVRSLARPFWAAGWTPADVAHALDHEPGGRQHIHTRDVAEPGAWARARLARWLGPDGRPLPSASQQRAAYAAQLKAEAARQRARTEARAARAAAGTGQSAAARGAAAAREQMLARNGPAAAALRRQGITSQRPRDGAVAAAGGVPGSDVALQPPEAENGRSGPQGAGPPPARLTGSNVV